jgi:hypothetical protein
MAIPTDHTVQEGLLWVNLSNYERGLRVLCCTQEGETYGTARHMI